MTSYAATVSRRLPRGWAHFALQFGIWMGFYAAYQVVRGAADRDVIKAFTNGEWVISTERKLGALIEPSLQRAVEGSSFLIELTSYTYWLSQFAIVGIALLWTYFKHYERFAVLRNWLIVANLLGLIGYVLMPTAPPRMFPAAGFTDTLAEHAAVNHDSGLIAFAANPYAAMPSLHAMDALIVTLTMVALVRSPIARVMWLAWAPWVWFSVMSTGNHYWLDVAAGVVLAGIAAAIVLVPRLLRRRQT